MKKCTTNYVYEFGFDISQWAFTSHYYISLQVFVKWPTKQVVHRQENTCSFLISMSIIQGSHLLYIHTHLLTMRAKTQMMNMEIIVYSRSYNLIRLFAQHVGCLAMWVKFQVHGDFSFFRYIFTLRFKGTPEEGRWGLKYPIFICNIVDIIEQRNSRRRLSIQLLDVCLFIGTLLSKAN